MIKVSNQKAINTLTIKSFKASRSRNIIAVIAIALTTILFTSLFTVGIGIVETIQNQTLRQAGGDGHVSLKYITEEQYNNIKKHPLINEITYNKTIADSVDNSELLKRHAEMYYMDKTARKLGFCEPTVGNAPKAENQIITDTITLDLLGVPHEIGATVPVIYTVKGEQYKKDFVLSGYWESDPVIKVGFIIVSNEFLEVNQNILQYTFSVDSYQSGSINSYIKFKNTFNLGQKLYRVIVESGYTVKDNKPETPDLATDIEYGINWAYVGSGGTDPSSKIAIILATLLIIFTGYLIIYNIFQISVQKDIRFYGLLKTIGTTSKQIRRIIRRQALLLAIIGIPLGLGLGFIIGKAILPLIMDLTNYVKKSAVVSVNPTIFFGAAVFSLLTIFLSTRKPGKVAAAVSPVEAVKYSGNSEIKKVTKKSLNGAKLSRMASANLTRNKKRTIISVLSLSLCLVLLNSVFTLSKGFDMDKYLSKFVDTDFLVGHANYFNLNHFQNPDDVLSESIVTAIQSEGSFFEGGRIYKNINKDQCSIVRENPDEKNRYHINNALDGMPRLDLYGMDDLPLSRLDIIEGELDTEKLKTGRYIIEGLGSDDDGSIYPEASHYSIGDTVEINVDGKTYKYELMAKTRVKNYTNTDRFASNYTMYLPSKEFLEIVSLHTPMTYAFNTKQGAEHEMETFLKNYTKNVEPLMNYESKQTYVDEFKGMQRMLLTVGGILSSIVGLIGILNFINSILTSILTRRREFAILQSIGMTKKQLVRMLMYEGLYYALLTIILSLLLGIAFSVGVIGGVVSKLWFFSYIFTVLPLILAYPLLIILSVLVPFFAYRDIEKQSVVERLREVE